MHVNQSLRRKCFAEDGGQSVVRDAISAPSLASYAPDQCFRRSLSEIVLIIQPCTCFWVWVPDCILQRRLHIFGRISLSVGTRQVITATTRSTLLCGTEPVISGFRVQRLRNTLRSDSPLKQHEPPGRALIRVTGSCSTDAPRQDP